MAKTKIEWATHSWNPVTGCTPISEGCQNCYARRMANRLRGRCGYPADDPFRVTLHPERLGEPLRWRKPSRVFVCSMGDLFHPDVQPIWLSMIFNVIRECPQHTFMVLTKRPEIALEHLGNAMLQPYFGLPNLWIGVTAENQQRADERIPILLQTPAAVRFISIEPCLGPVDLSYYLPKNPKKNCPENILPYYNSHGLNWVICGSETGPLARPMKEEWVKNIKDQCVGADVPFFYKQKIVNGQKVALPELEGKQWAEFPEVKP
jgi:protein gp37